MKALLFHAKKYGNEFHSFSNRTNLKEKTKSYEKQNINNCVVVFVCVEIKDNNMKADKLVSEIEKMCNEVKNKKVVIAPFAHLSNKLADADLAIKIVDYIENKLKNKFEVHKTHFGSNKSLLLDVYGHAGNVRYREVL